MLQRGEDSALERVWSRRERLDQLVTQGKKAAHASPHKRAVGAPARLRPTGHVSAANFAFDHVFDTVLRGGRFRRMVRFLLSAGIIRSPPRSTPRSTPRPFPLFLKAREVLKSFPHRINDNDSENEFEEAKTEHDTLVSARWRMVKSLNAAPRPSTRHQHLRCKNHRRCARSFRASVAEAFLSLCAPAQ